MIDVCVIGCGNMGGALLRGLHGTDDFAVTACDADESVLEAVAPYADRTTTDAAAATAGADVVIVAVKPDVVDAVLDALDLTPEQTLVTIAAGVTTDYVAARTEATVVRVMPNLAAETRNMAAAVAWAAPDDDVAAILDHLGEYVEIEEDLMDVATALNGSGPAFVFYLLGAMADAAVAEGMDAAAARTLAAQTFKGAAETVLRSEREVEDLIDAVCSPNGTTIEGMEMLWESDADRAVGDALAAAAERSRELARERDHE